MHTSLTLTLVALATMAFGFVAGTSWATRPTRDTVTKAEFFAVMQLINNTHGAPLDTGELESAWAHYHQDPMAYEHTVFECYLNIVRNEEVKPCDASTC